MNSTIIEKSQVYSNFQNPSKNSATTWPLLIDFLLYNVPNLGLILTLIKNPTDWLVQPSELISNGAKYSY